MIGVIAMWQSHDMNERIWRVIFFALALLMIIVINTWQEAMSEGERRAQVEERIAAIRTSVSGNATGTWHLSAKHMRSFEVVDIPLLLEALEREDEQVGYVLSQIITEIGRLQLSADSWSTTAEWKQLWNESVQRAEDYSEQILHDQQMGEQERAKSFMQLGAPVLPHLIRYSASEYLVGDGVVTALRAMLGESEVPQWRNAGERRVWALKNQDKYSGLGYKFE